jgi:hypothetical protein
MNITFIPFDKKKEKTSLRIFIYHRGQEYRIPAGESVMTKYWNENKYRCKLVREYPDAAAINKNLDDIEDALKKIIDGYGLVTPTEQQVKADFKEYKKNLNIKAGGIVEGNSQNFVDFAIKYKKEADRKGGTKKHYNTTIKKLLKYESKYKVKLQFADINMDFYNSFKKWMLNSTYTRGGIEFNYSKNYIGSMFKNISMFMNKSKKKKFTTSMDTRMKILR